LTEDKPFLTPGSAQLSELGRMPLAG